jgi:hypothetical protein
MPRKAIEPNWQKSDAKKLLQQDIQSGDIPLDSESMTPWDAFFQRPDLPSLVAMKTF